MIGPQDLGVARSSLRQLWLAPLGTNHCVKIATARGQSQDKNQTCQSAAALGIHIPSHEVSCHRLFTKMSLKMASPSYPLEYILFLCLHIYFLTDFLRYNLHTVKLTHFNYAFHAYWWCIQSCNHHDSQNTGHFHHHQRFLMPFWGQSLLRCLASGFHCLLPATRILSLLELHINES